MVMNGHLYNPAALPPQKKTPVTIEGWVGLRAGLDAWEKRNIFFSCRNSNTGSSSP
jgi:hypothetical protein